MQEGSKKIDPFKRKRFLVQSVISVILSRPGILWSWNPSSQTTILPC